MDTEVARTFLAVVSTGSFVRAAQHLNVTQSTVSARIRTLEQYLRCTLFVRNKGGTTLTVAGRRFQKHATMLVRTAEQARHDVGVPQGYRGSVTIGGRFGLWEGFLFRWLAAMRQSATDISLRVEIGFEADLMEGLISGRLDIGVMYAPHSRPEHTVEHLFDEVLVLVSTSRMASPRFDQSYVFVDWGPEFYAKHDVTFGDFPRSALIANVGWLGLRYIKERGGSGYFPRRLVSDDTKSKKLFVVPGAPEFAIPAYAVYSSDFDEGSVGASLKQMRLIIKKIDK